jgi:hypothetical protein
MCAGAAPGKITLHVVTDTGLSTALDDAAAELAESGLEVHDLVVEVRRLDDMLVEAHFDRRPIHFLKIDVEGLEADVLSGIDLESIRPWVIVVEATTPRSNEPTHEAWEHLITGHRYEFCLFDGLNRFYLAAEHADLTPKLSYPACVFDHPFITPPHRKLLAEHESALAGVKRIEAAYRDTVESYRRLEEEHLRAQAAHEDLVAEHDRVIRAWSDLEVEHHRVTASWTRLEADFNAVVRSNQDLNDQCETYRLGVIEMAAEIESLRAEIDQQRQETTASAALEAVLSSTSWRATAPLRWVLDRLRRSARHDRAHAFGRRSGATSFGRRSRE